jgi:hypothetical protein
MNPEVEQWLEIAAQTKENLSAAILGFTKLSETYESIRNVGYKNDEKEAIDIAYNDIYTLHSELCKLQAGGAKRKSPSRKHKKTLKKRVR